ncbi:MAG TPA: SGNH/GDSL hydrolase family protein, partial [Isosphaeraceae bacterium]|nr:SGNH/GDSL hydrolase family protein [Isosphaeraceae bacterium]
HATFPRFQHWRSDLSLGKQGPMATRNRRTLVLESLEGRVVLSRPASLTLAALGDSYTAEYAVNPTGNDGARNWVEILSATGRASFGSRYSPVALNAPNPDFPYDRAVLGATTTDVLRTQLPAVLPAVASGSVKSVCLFAGINDFGAVVLNLVEHPESAPADLSSQVDEALATAQSNLDRIVMTLFQANPQVKLAVATIPLVPSLPLMVQALNRPGGQALATDLNTAILTYNNHIRNLSYLYPSVALVDVASTFQANLAPPGASAYVASSGPSLTDVFQVDGLHPNTIPQGWIANDFLSALSTQTGIKTSTISSRQINQYAHVALWRQKQGMPLP